MFYMIEIHKRYVYLTRDATYSHIVQITNLIAKTKWIAIHLALSKCTCTQIDDILHNVPDTAKCLNTSTLFGHYKAGNRWCF